MVSQILGPADSGWAVEKRGTVKMLDGLKKESDENLGQWFFGEGTWNGEKAKPMGRNWPVESRTAGSST